MAGRRKVEAIHAWGVVTLGVGLFAGIPTVEAVVKQPNTAPDWWFIPGLILAGVLVTVGLVLVTTPVVPEVKRKDRPGPAPVPTALDREGDRLIAYYREGPSPDRVALITDWMAKVDAEAQRWSGRKAARELRSGSPDLPEAALRRREWLTALPGHTPLGTAKPDAKWLTYLPIVVDGQLRITMRHSQNDEGTFMTLWGCHAEIVAPDGMFRQQKPGLGSGVSSGVYVLHYPQDFTGATRLRPGRYEIRWYGTDPKTGFDGKPEARVLVATDSVTLSDALKVERV